MTCEALPDMSGQATSPPALPSHLTLPPPPPPFHLHSRCWALLFRCRCCCRCCLRAAVASSCPLLLLLLLLLLLVVSSLLSPLSSSLSCCCGGFGGFGAPLLPALGARVVRSPLVPGLGLRSRPCPFWPGPVARCGPSHSMRTVAVGSAFDRRSLFEPAPHSAIMKPYHGPY